jgi:16S rRNA (guanine966-N2)-methyltransferase
MQILAGRYKGLSIKTSAKLPYRPTKSRVRKSIFDKLTPFEFETVLDLFSGSGIMGFESASRGAYSVTFVEKHGNALAHIQENSKKFTENDFQFKRQDVFSFLKGSDGFDLIFADPPYRKYDVKSMTEIILELLNKNGKFILECEKGQEPFLDADASDYGDTRILTWTNK